MIWFCRLVTGPSCVRRIQQCTTGQYHSACSPHDCNAHLGNVGTVDELVAVPQVHVLPVRLDQMPHHRALQSE